MNADPFRQLAGSMVVDKLNLIRKTGNKAVHDDSRISRSEALGVVSELFHVLVWATRHHTPNPEQAPSGKKFDANLAQEAAALSPAQRNQLVANFEAQQNKLEQQLREHTLRTQEQEAEIAQLRAQIKQAATKLANLPDHDYNEAETRKWIIDLQLRESGWNVDAAHVREYPVDNMPNYAGVGKIDYVLWGADKRPLAVIEAKRLAKSAAAAQQQASLYAQALGQKYGREPVIYYANGSETYLWDKANGYPPRRVQGYATRDQLELMVARRTARKQLHTIDINPEIAGRYYQTRAIESVSDALAGHRRKALLVMATGSGKTRTVIALVERLLKAGWVKNVLFLADRTALVTQAVSAFKDQLPSEPTVNLSGDASGTGRIYAATYQTMMNRINEFTPTGERRFGPNYFDLLIIDEAHRSVYAKFGAIFDWFDSYLVGLTATPKDEVDHNTYNLFELESGNPTDEYSLDQAVDDKYLVPSLGMAVTTKFLANGIKYDDLTPEERDEWDTIDWGTEEAPDEITSEELNRFLFNKDTIDLVLAQLMSEGYKVAGGERLGKTIIFAKNQLHAEFIQERFNVQYPHYAGKFARVITYQSSYAHTLIDDFKAEDKNPHIAISVDMLDTGIDVPEVVNLVFFKQVRSKVKFWQMIGRGTRLRPDLYGPGLDKTDFKVFDYCGNLEYFSQNLPGATGTVPKSLTQKIVEFRIDLAFALGAGQLNVEMKDPEIRELRNGILDDLHSFVEGIAPENFLVRPKLPIFDRFKARTAWSALVGGAEAENGSNIGEESIDPQEAAEQAKELSGLPSAVQLGDSDAKRFDLLILRRQHAQLTGDNVQAEKIRITVQDLAANLLTKTNIPAVAEQAELLEQVVSDDWWVGVTLPMLELVRKRMRGLLRLVEPTKRKIVYTDFEDAIGGGVSVRLPGISMNVNKERFRAKVLAFLNEHEAHPAILKLRYNEPFTTSDLHGLELVLADAGGVSVDTIAELAQQNGGLALFVRSIVGLERSAIAKQFAQFLDRTHFNANQIRFVEHIIDELSANGVMEPKRLWEEPFTDPAMSGPEELFPDGEYTQIIEYLRQTHGTLETGS
jgi:type I restriction enzyme R subunit